MNGTEVVLSEVFVQSVTFSEGVIEVQYLENRNQGEFEKKLEVLVMRLDPSRPKYLTAFQELQETLCELVDDALLYKRNPPETIPGRVRFNPDAT